MWFCEDVAMDPVAKRIRRSILDISHASGHGHIPTCFSVTEALLAIHRVMRHDPRDPMSEDRDIFVLSKGHAALGYYCVLAEYGYVDLAEVYGFGSFGTRFGCHADRTKIPGVALSTGSLGHGIGVAVGMALGLKIRGSDRRVFVLVGDGESNEGTVWEAVMVATDRKLDNLTIVYDDNKSQGRCLSIPNPGERLASFGCDVVVAPGHDIGALTGALARRPGKVNALVAQTRKGYGCETLATNFYEWHRKSPDTATLPKLVEELNAWAV
jgi:transketolase